MTEVHSDSGEGGGIGEQRDEAGAKSRSAKRPAALALVVLCALAGALVVGFVVGRGADGDDAETAQGAARITAARWAAWQALVADDRSSLLDEARASSEGGAAEESLREEDEELIARLPESEQDGCARVMVPSISDVWDQLICVAEDRVITWWPDDSPQVLYSLFVDDLGVTEGAGSCPTATPSEREWIGRLGHLGRYACWKDAETGQPYVAWIHEPLNKMALASVPRASTLSLSDLYEWWSKDERPLVHEEEYAFYEAIPVGVRGDCVFALWGPEDWTHQDEGSIMEAHCGGRLYSQFATAEEMRRAYEDDWPDKGIAVDSGACPTQLPAEGTWSRDGRTLGRQACWTNTVEETGTTYSIIAWTTEPLRIKGIARDCCTPEVMTDLYDWWSKEAGPVYNP